jgi:hypothetical protein
MVSRPNRLLVEVISWSMLGGLLALLSWASGGLT